MVKSLASRWTFVNLLALMAPFCLPPVSFVPPKPIPTLFLSTCNASPAASPPGGSESGRSTPSLSTYSDGKSPSSTYVAAPRHFHIPGMPRLYRSRRDPAFVLLLTRHRLDGAESWAAIVSRWDTKPQPSSVVGFDILKHLSSSGYMQGKVGWAI